MSKFCGGPQARKNGRVPAGNRSKGTEVRASGAHRMPPVTRWKDVARGAEVDSVVDLDPELCEQCLIAW